MTLCVISVVLLILAFLNFNLSFLAFVSFVPLFFALEHKSPLKAFFISYLCGFLFYLGVLYWLYHVTVIGLVILCLYLALYFGIFGFFYSKLTAHSLQLTAIPLVWSFLEYIQSYLFTGFGWALLGYSQYRNIPFIQIADFARVYGISFVIMLVNVVAWRLIKRCLENRKQKTENRKKILFSVFRYLLSMIFIFSAVHTYGSLRLNDKNVGLDSIKISVIQGNIPQELKWDSDAAQGILNKYTVLTKIASLDEPDLIIWPETSFPGFLIKDTELTDSILNLAREVKAPLLIGANTIKDSNYFNSAVLVSEKGSIAQQYDKLHLVPFGEYVPFSKKFPILHSLILGELGEFTPGKDFTLFILHPPPYTNSVNFGVLICFEDIFPELSHQFVKRGAQFLIVITNDAWYGKSSAPFQHAACSVFRAIENRVPVVRCANTGYSCFIDSKGRIYDTVQQDGTSLFVTGHKTSKVKIATPSP